MSRTLDKFRKRNIFANISHFVLVIFVVAVSVCLISGLFISHLTFKKSIEKFYSNSNLPNLWITTDKITAEDEDFFSKYDYGKRYCFESDFFVSEKKYVSKFIVSDGKVSIPYIEGNKGNGCYVDAKFAEKYGIYSDYSKIRFDFNYGGETKCIDFNVVGTLSMAEDLLTDDDCLIYIDERVFLKTLARYFEQVSEDDLFQIDYNQILITSNISDYDKEGIKNYYKNSSSSCYDGFKK